MDVANELLYSEQAGSDLLEKMGGVKIKSSTCPITKPTGANSTGTKASELMNRTAAAEKFGAVP